MQEVLLMGAQAGKPRVGLGKSKVRGLVNQEYAVTGVALVAIGIIMAWIVSQTDLISKIIDDKLLNVIILGIGLTFIITGVAVFAAAWAVTMEKVYLRNGACQIVDGKVKCKGGCTQCVFAARYVQMNNPDENGMPRE